MAIVATAPISKATAQTAPEAAGELPALVIEPVKKAVEKEESGGQEKAADDEHNFAATDCA